MGLSTVLLVLMLFVAHVLGIAAALTAVAFDLGRISAPHALAACAALGVSAACLAAVVVRYHRFRLLAAELSQTVDLEQPSASRAVNACVRDTLERSYIRNRNRRVAS